MSGRPQKLKNKNENYAWMDDLTKSDERVNIGPFDNSVGSHFTSPMQRALRLRRPHSSESTVVNLNFHHSDQNRP